MLLGIGSGLLRWVTMPGMSDDILSLSPAGDLLASIPGVLGFIPTRSMVLLTYDAAGGPVASMRYDLDLTADGEVSAGLSAVFAELGAILAGYRVRAAVAVLVDDRYRPTDPRYRAVLETAAPLLGRLTLGFVVGGCIAGALWHTVWRGPSCAPLAAPPPDHGPLPDPATSPAALERAVRTGRSVLPGRSMMGEMLVEGEHCQTRHRPEPSDAAVGAEPAALLRQVLDAAREADRIRCGTLRLDCERVHGLDAAVRQIQVRDAVMALAVTDLRDGAERLYRELTRRLRGTGRAAAATLLAHLHYVAGEGGYAGVALDCALAADPAYRLAGLLDRALRAGMPPTELADLVESSRAVARDLGVPLPPRRQSFCTNSE